MVMPLSFEVVDEVLILLLHEIGHKIRCLGKGIQNDLLIFLRQSEEDIIVHQEVASVGYVPRQVDVFLCTS